MDAIAQQELVQQSGVHLCDRHVALHLVYLFAHSIRRHLTTTSACSMTTPVACLASSWFAGRVFHTKCTAQLLRRVWSQYTLLYLVMLLLASPVSKHLRSTEAALSHVSYA